MFSADEPPSAEAVRCKILMIPPWSSSLNLSSIPMRSMLVSPTSGTDRTTSAPVEHEIDIGVINLHRMNLIQDHQRAKHEQNIVKITSTYALDTDIFVEEHDPTVREDPRNRPSDAFIPSNIGNHVTVEHTAGYGSVSYMSLVFNTDLWCAPTM